jgi:2-polyprenyl-3-methyl-5-hydroxy-6-metoxy-1,4-benzoquinol methylase
VNHRIVGEGQIDFPCIPSMLDFYMTKLTNLWEILGKPFTEPELASLRGLLKQQLEAGYKASRYARVIVGYQSRPMPEGIKYVIRLNAQTMEDIYSTGWVSDEKQTPFGRLPDAKVTALAAQLGEPGDVPVLDIGAGTGRNSLPLARLGHPVTAVEPVARLSDEMRKVADAEKIPLQVIGADFLSPTTTASHSHYKLAILAEVVSHFRDLGEVRQLFAKLAETMAPGGLVLVSCFLSAEGYKPDTAAREACGFAWCSLFTRAELKFIVDDLPFDRMSDESVHDYEKENLPEGGWPPTPWFVTWSQGSDAFDVPVGKAPVDLRWLVYRRRTT